MKSNRARATKRLSLAALLVLAAGCAQVEFENRAVVARERAQAQPPAGSTYAGWRVFQARCASCHGTDAAGAAGPDLLPRLREMGPQRFVDLVLRRYDWNLAAPQSGAGREALVEDIVQRRAGTVSMPAWQGEPEVSAHIADLYAYLSARSAGTQGPGRPAP